jgi:hypothetical protein
MMFGYGGGWPFWEVGLMWVGMIAFWGVLPLGDLRAGDQHGAQAARHA